MQISISTRHGQISPSTKEKIATKLEKLTRFHERITAINVTVDREHDEESEVELRVTVEKAGEFVSKKTKAGLFSALDGAIHKMEEQLRRHKNKSVDHRPKHGADDLAPALEDAGGSDDEDIFDD